MKQLFDHQQQQHVDSEPALFCRCGWANAHADYLEYHDREWGVPVHDDHKLFEFLLLEGAQAGLSWITILRKRENYRRAFADFDAKTIAGYTKTDVERLLADPGIVRNRLKIQAAITNARVWLDLQAEFVSGDCFLWQFVGGKPLQNAWKTMADMPAQTKESDAMSNALKKRGCKFVGSTICYAFMQATGMVNDHLVSCFRYREVSNL